MATTLDFQDHRICEIDGDVRVQNAEFCSVDPGADTHDVKRLLLAEVRVAVFHISSFAWTHAYSEACQKLLQVVSNTNVILLQEMETFLPNAVSNPMTIPIFGHAS